MDLKNGGATLSGKAWLWLLIALIVSFLLVFTASGLHPIRRTLKQNASLETFTAHLNNRIPALMKFYNIPGSSIALVKGGEIVWLGAYGYADIENGRRLTTDTPMRVQSISKPVTAWGIMRLAEQGKIDLDGPVTQYLKNWQFPESGFSAEQVTVRQLLSHTAGLPLGDVFTIYSPKEEMPSLEEQLAKEAVLTGKPGASFAYSNIGFNLLELLIEEITGRDFAEYMEQEIMAPLGMRRSSFVWSEVLDPAVPVGYDLGGRPVPVYLYPEKASGGLFATAEDIAAFAIAGMPGFPHAKPVLSPWNIEALYTPVSDRIGIYGLVFDAYGLGYYLETLPNGKRAVAHGGQGTGIMTHFHVVPETGDAIVILTNSQRSWPFISYLLSDWAQWRGLPSVGMGRIIWGKYGLWTLIGLVWFAVLLQALRLAGGILAGKRKTAPRTQRFRLVRCVQVGVSAALIAGLAWCLCQKYLFLSSVFPVVYVWLVVTALALAVILLLSALLPYKGEDTSGGTDR